MAVVERHESPDGQLSLVVERDELGDIAVGFEGCPWHTHGDTLAALSGLPESEALREFVHDVLQDRAIIAVAIDRSKRRGAWITDDPQSDLVNKPDDESIHFRYWSGAAHQGDDPHSRPK